LDAVRMQDGKLHLSPARVSLNMLIAEVLGDFRLTAKANMLTLAARVPRELPLAWADPRRVRQIVANLIENAIKFTPRDGTITAGAAVWKQSSRFLCVSVCDTGCGISPADQEKIFDRLYQVPGGESSHGRGLGLGLHICRELVRRQGGDIWVESQMGKGTSVNFTIPTCQEQTTRKI